MPQLRNPRRVSHASVAKGRVRATYQTGGPTGAGCVASDQCNREVVDDCPVQLCAKHIREVYTYAHAIVAAELDRMATRAD